MPIAGWKQFKPVYFYTALVVCLIAVTRDENFSWYHNLLFIGVGVFSWTLMEYALHRFIFHYSARSVFGRKLVYAAHLSHHENPRATNRFFSSLALSLPVSTGYVLLARIITGSWHAAAYLFAGLAAGYFCYEWLHFQAHHRRPRLRLFRYLRKYHLLHHYQTPHHRFGVTTPLLDLIFGTFRPVRKPLRFTSRETRS
ncbi:MAG TPA: sterol desaturase family protein [Pyrinomonadaceae bacterium]|nr:sterol desaturase family protein [Pyrinomonadaceae bacterium]